MATRSLSPKLVLERMQRHRHAVAILAMQASARWRTEAKNCPARGLMKRVLRKVRTEHFPDQPPMRRPDQASAQPPKDRALTRTCQVAKGGHRWRSQEPSSLTYFVR
jgi:hypothetical protein